MCVVAARGIHGRRRLYPGTQVTVYHPGFRIPLLITSYYPARMRVKTGHLAESVGDPYERNH